MWLGLEQHKLCTGTTANKCYVADLCMWYGVAIVTFPPHAAGGKGPNLSKREDGRARSVRNGVAEGRTR